MVKCMLAYNSSSRITLCLNIKFSLIAWFFFSVVKKWPAITLRPLTRVRTFSNPGLVWCSGYAVFIIYQKWSKKGHLVSQWQGRGRPGLIDTVSTGSSSPIPQKSCWKNECWEWQNCSVHSTMQCMRLCGCRLVGVSILTLSIDERAFNGFMSIRTRAQRETTHSSPSDAPAISLQETQEI